MKESFSVGLVSILADRESRRVSMIESQYLDELVPIQEVQRRRIQQGLFRELGIPQLSRTSSQVYLRGTHYGLISLELHNRLRFTNGSIRVLASIATASFISVTLTRNYVSSYRPFTFNINRNFDQFLLACKSNPKTVAVERHSNFPISNNQNYSYQSMKI